jgi:hypothetical protein
MARGWESKDAETQTETNEEKRRASRSGPKDPEQMLRDQEVKGLRLSRTRILNDLQLATNQNYRKSLEAALAYLDKKIGELENS